MEKNQLESRREFLKKLSFFAGSGLLMTAAPGMSFAEALQDNKKSPNDRIRIGIIGVGSRGRYHVLVLNQMPEVEITAVCDNYPPNYDRAKNLTNGKAEAYWDYRELLAKNKPDAVVIATPLHEHAQMTIDALKSGCHVLCEKSMAITTDESIAMAKAQQETGKVLFVGHQRRWDIKYLKAKEMADSGFFGKITQIRAWWHRNNDWRRAVPKNHFPNHPNWKLDPEYPTLEHKVNHRLYREYSRGLMTELASHQIHVANWFMNKLPIAVRGSGSINYWYDGREVFDNVNLVYDYPGGVHLIYDSMTSNKQYSLEEQIMGVKGAFELENGKYFYESPPAAPGILQMINEIEHQIFDNVPLGGKSWVPESAADTSGEFFTDDYPLPNSTQLQNEAFLECIRKNKIIPGLLEEYLYATIASLMGDEAMMKNETVYWPEEKLKVLDQHNT
jgi:predicted dehydrogenase